MKIKGQLQWTDYLNSSLLHLQPTGQAKVLGYSILIFFGFGILGSLYLSSTGRLPIGSLVPGAIFLAFIALFRYVFLPRRVKKIFFQQQELSLPFEIEFTGNGMNATNDIGNSNRPWTNFIKWKENEELLLLYHSDVLYNIIPKRIFTDPQQIEAIKSYLINNKIPVAKSRTARVGCAIYMILIIVIIFILTVNLTSRVP